MSQWRNCAGERHQYPPDKSGKKSIPFSHHDPKIGNEVRSVIETTFKPTLILGYYVHCLNGSEVTGLCGGIRKLQLWASQCELQHNCEQHDSFDVFLDGFVAEVEIPNSRWDGFGMGLKA